MWARTQEAPRNLENSQATGNDVLATASLETLDGQGIQDIPLLEFSLDECSELGLDDLEPLERLASSQAPVNQPLEGQPAEGEQLLGSWPLPGAPAAQQPLLGNDDLAGSLNLAELTSSRSLQLAPLPRASLQPLRSVGWQPAAPVSQPPLQHWMPVQPPAPQLQDFPPLQPPPQPQQQAQYTQQQQADAVAAREQQRSQRALQCWQLLQRRQLQLQSGSGGDSSVRAALALPTAQPQAMTWPQQAGVPAGPLEQMASDWARLAQLPEVPLPLVGLRGQQQQQHLHQQQQQQHLHQQQHQPTPLPPRWQQQSSLHTWSLPLPSPAALKAPQACSSLARSVSAALPDARAQPFDPALPLPGAGGLPSHQAKRARRGWGALNWSLSSSLDSAQQDALQEKDKEIAALRAEVQRLSKMLRLWATQGHVTKDQAAQFLAAAPRQPLR